MFLHYPETYYSYISSASGYNPVSIIQSYVHTRWTACYHSRSYTSQHNDIRCTNIKGNQCGRGKGIIRVLWFEDPPYLWFGRGGAPRLQAVQNHRDIQDCRHQRSDRPQPQFASKGPHVVKCPSTNKKLTKMCYRFFLVGLSLIALVFPMTIGVGPPLRTHAFTHSSAKILWSLAQGLIHSCTFS